MQVYESPPLRHLTQQSQWLTYAEIATWCDMGQQVNRLHDLQE